MKSTCLPTLLALILPAGAAAEAPDAALVQAAVILTTFDRLDAGCAGAYSPAQREQVQRWQADNAVDALRARLPALQADAQLAERVDRSARQIVQVARSKGANDCAAATSPNQLPDAQLGRLATAPRAAPAAEPIEAESIAAPAPLDAAALEQIEGFAFATRPKMGLGGFMALDIYPVVLFKSGDLLNDVRALRFGAGRAAHRQAHPEAWSRWRRAGGKLQWLKSGQWADLPFNKTYARLPAGLRLSGQFRSSSGVGTVAVGGQQSVTRVDEYRFSADGRVMRSGAVGGTAQAGDTRVVTRGGPGERAGRYRVDGLLLSIDYDDGSREQRVLITDPDKPGGTIWLDGESYVPRR
jgi:hypothetical protein